MTTVPDYIPDDLVADTAALLPRWTVNTLAAAYRDGGHDHRDADSRINLEAILTAAVVLGRDICRHCRPDLRPVPMYGTAWAVEWLHSTACPDGDDE